MASKNRKLTAAEVRFCTIAARGDKTMKSALVEAFPKYRSCSNNTIDVQARRLLEKPGIVQKIAELKSELCQVIEEEDIITKKEVIQVMADGFREATQGSKMAVVDCVPLIKQMSTMMGWDAPKDINVRNGGFTADYKGPPTLMTMSDEEITQKLKELRGGK